MNRLCQLNPQIETRTLKKKEDWLVILGYPGLVLAALLLSVFFPIGEHQFLSVAIVVGVRWVTRGIANEVRVVIIERSQS